MPAERTIPGGESGLLRAALQRVRRRLFLIALARHASIATTVSAGAALVMMVSGIQVRWAGVTTAAALAMAAGAAIRQRPTLRDTARACDRRLGLDDRVMAALEHIDGEDEISRFIVRDAAARLGQAAIPDVFPMTAGRQITIAVTSVLVTLVASSLGGDRTTMPGTVRNGGDGMAIAAAPREGDAPAESQTALRDESMSGAPRNADTSTAPRTSTALQPAAPTVNRADAPEANGSAQPSDSTAERVQPRGDEGGPARNTGEQSTAPSRAATSATGGTGRTGSASNMDDGRTSAAAAAGGSGQQTSAVRLGAGGVQFGGLSIDGTPGSSSAASREIRATRGSGSATTVTDRLREHVPPHRRRLVSDYLSAIAVEPLQ